MMNARIQAIKSEPMADKKRTVQMNPLDITESLGYTTFRRDSRKPWTKEEDVALRDLVHENLMELGYIDGIGSLKRANWHLQSLELPQRIDWEEIGNILQTRKAKDCRKRWMNSLDPNLRRGKWTTEEDEALIEAFTRYGSSWQKISLEIPGRTDDQCAKRYIEVLDPNTRDRLRPWTIEEDLNLIKKVKMYGTKWRTISLEMKSRPSLTCRNRWRKIVTDVVRGKTSPQIKEEIDSIEGGLSKLQEISETLKHEEKEGEEEAGDDMHHVPQHKQQKPDARLDGNFNPPGMSETQKPISTQMDWKFTLKDSTGLSVSSGVIASTELAHQLIEAVKQNDLKISIHQHIHHHYASTSGVAKGQSPDGSASNFSGSHTEDVIPNRYTHFNYLPAMVQPQLESSSMGTKESDLSRLLNPQERQHQQYRQQQHQQQQQLNPVPYHHEVPNQHPREHQQNHQHQTHHQPHKVQPPNHKRRLSTSSTGSSRKEHKPSNDMHNTDEIYEELDGEVDFWEKMGSLSQVRAGTHKGNENYRELKEEQFGMIYGAFPEEEEHDTAELEEELRDIVGILAFNPS